MLGCPPSDPGDETSASATEPTSTTTTTGTSTGESTMGSGIQTVTSATGTEGGSSGGSSSGGDVCADAVAGLAAAITSGEPCEVLVHLDESAAPLGIAVVCGASGTTWTTGKEVSAATQCCMDGLIYAEDSDLGPVYVVHVDNPAGADGVAIASNHTGRVVLDALTGEGEPGPIAVPTAWTDPAALAVGQGCGDPGFSLAGAQSYNLASDGAALVPDALEGLAAALGDTALGPALAQASTPVRSLVVRYSPQNGGPPHDFVLLEVEGN